MILTIGLNTFMDMTKPRETVKQGISEREEIQFSD